LSDGSKVTLNAATSLRFPASFSATERRVEVDGEAYFEVAKDNQRPFRVVVATPGSKAQGTLVEVLGTHFNVNAYGDESQMCTTLLEGSVKVHNRADSQNVLAIAQELRPGQQARVGGSKAIEVSKVDVSEVVAWQQDLFHFAGADSREIMRQLARWYDLDIAYKGQFGEKRFTGKISRLMALQDVLEILEQGGLRFEVQGRKITLRS
jgi:ferric-dicitrate binding protein FerR (iron transport regulator)